MSILLAVFVAVLSGYLFGALFKRLGLPSVVGQVLGGVLLGLSPLRSTFLEAANANVIAFLADVGAVLLFFFVGLEINATQARKDMARSVSISVFNTGIPLLAGYFFSTYVLGLDFTASLIVGISLAVSSQAVSIEFLEEMRLLKSRIGNLIVVAGAVDDFIEGLLITIILAVFQVSLSTPSLLALVLGAVVFLLVIAALKQFVVPLLLKEFGGESSTSSLFGGALVLTLFVAVLSESLGFSSLVGALIAGMITRSTLLSGKSRQPWREHSLAHLIHALAFGFFVPIFFTKIGLSTDVSSLAVNFPIVIALSLVGMVSLLFGTMVGVKLVNGDWYEGFIVGLGLLPKGDVELVVLTIGLENNLISPAVYSLLVAMAMLLTILGPLLFKYFVVVSNPRLVAAALPRRGRKPI